MENLRILAENIDQKNEIISMFISIGYNRESTCSYNNDDLMGIHVYADGDIQDVLIGDYYDGKHKEITLPQLRDMVVLKRNNVNDRNVVDPEYTANLYLDSKGKLFVFHIPARSWKTSNLNGEEEVMQRLKPIKEKEMKEFLVNHDGKWTLQLLDADTEENSYRVAVPIGADIYWQEDGEYWFTTELMGYRDAEIVWQRHAHPEELPFVDDEPKSLNDTYAEIEQVRQHNHYFKDVSDIEQMDVYEVLKRFEVTDPCLQHIVKKALCAGQRGHKDFKKDLQDILDTAVRAVDINK